MQKKIIVAICCFLSGYLFTLGYINKEALLEYGSNFSSKIFKSEEPLKKNRFLLMISSWKRPMLLSGQILRFMNQTYDNYKISVSIKGTPEDWIRSTFMKEWQPFIDKGSLLVRFDENKEQLSNLLDTIRNIPLDEYDYFCKIDDDDWYAPNYLEEVNRYLNKEKDIDISSTLNMVILDNGDDQVKMYYSPLDWSGQTICISRPMAKALLEIEENPAAYEPLYPASEVLRLRSNKEDALIHHFIRAIGGKPQERDTPKTDIIYGRQYPSITRY